MSGTDPGELVARPSRGLSAAWFSSKRDDLECRMLMGFGKALYVCTAATSEMEHVLCSFSPRLQPSPSSSKFLLNPDLSYVFEWNSSHKDLDRKGRECLRDMVMYSHGHSCQPTISQTVNPIVRRRNELPLGKRWENPFKFRAKGHMSFHV